MIILRNHDYDSTSWQGRSSEWNHLSQLLFNGEGEYPLNAPATVKPYDDFIRHLFVRTTPSTLASIKIDSDETILIAGSRKALYVLGDNAEDMTSISVGDHCHVDCLILSEYLTEDSVLSVWQRLPDSE